MFNLAAKAVRKVNPQLLVGGPAAARTDLLNFADRFIAETKGSLDFYSCHTYASGSVSDTTEAIFSRAASIVADTTKLQQLVHEKCGSKVPLFLDEFNISWTWETRDVRMTNGVGAVFDALVLIGAARAGIVGTMAWNERDGIYGKTSTDGSLRPSAYLYETLNKYGVGDIVSAASSDGEVKPFAVIENGHRTLWLVNMSASKKSLARALKGDISVIADSGCTKLAEVHTLPGYSVTCVKS
jgi:hypothetical protein